MGTPVLDRILNRLEEWIVVTLIGAATILTFVAVVHRYGANDHGGTVDSVVQCGDRSRKPFGAIDGDYDIERRNVDGDGCRTADR